jgi:hypothetical protein
LNDYLFKLYDDSIDWRAVKQVTMTTFSIETKLLILNRIANKDYVESENNRCKVQWLHSLLKDINSLRVRILMLRFFVDSKNFR